MAQGGRVEYTIGFNVDKSGLNDIKKQLKEINTMTAKEVQLNNPGLNMNEAMSALKKAQIAASELEKAMNSAFNPKLGITNLDKLQASLNKLNLNDIQQRFSAIGAKGEQAFLNIAKSALTTNVSLKQTSKFIDKIGTTLVNTVKWQFSSSLVNRFTGAVQQAVGYVEHLDTSLNDIRIVTGKSADEMERFAVKANKAAQELGKATTDYTEASLIFYQQGLGDEEVAARASTTLKAANVTGQSTAAVSEELTAVWNGYKVATEDTEAAVDKLAAVAATTASDLQELSTGMSKVASAANSMGVDMDQLNAQIATIISVTRQAPESVGTALKTIYARLADLKLGETDEDGLGLGDVSGTLQKVGIEVLDVNGDLREMGDVIEEVAAKWDTWTSAQQAAIAQSMAGKRQYNNLVALFDNWDMYSSALETSKNSIGTLQKQQDIYMESTEAHIQMLKTEWEDLYDSIIDEDAIKTVTNGLRGILNIITNIIDGLGGGKTLITGMVALIGTKFGKQIAQLMNPFIENMKNAKTNAAQLETILTNIETSRKNGDFGFGAAKAMREAQETMSQYWHLMSEEEFNASQENIREIGTWTQKKEEIEKAEQALHNYIEAGNNQTLKKQIQGRTFFTDSNDASKGIGDTIKNNLLKAFEGASKDVNNLSKAYQSATKNIDNFNQAQKTGTLDDKKRQKTISSLENALAGMEYNLKQTKNFGKNIIDEESFKKAENALDKLRQKIDKLKEPGANKQIIGKDIVKSLEEVMNVTNMAENELKVFYEVLRSGGTIEEATAKLNTYREALQQSTFAIQQKIEAVSQLIGGLSSLVFAFQSLSNIGRIFKDEDLTAGEKFGQILSNILISLPMLMSGYGTLITSLKTLTGTTLLLTTAERNKILVEQKETLTIGKKVLTILGLNTAMKTTLITMGAFTAGIIAVVGAIKIFNYYQEKKKQAIIDSNNAIIEECKAQEEENNKIQESIRALRDLTEEYKRGAFAKDEFLRKSLANIEGLDREAIAAINAADSYEAAIKALDDYDKRVAQGNIENKRKELEAATANVFTEAGGVLDEETGKYKFKDSTLTGNDFQKEEVDKEVAELRSILGEENVSTRSLPQGKEQEIVISIDPNDKDTLDNFVSYLNNEGKNNSVDFKKIKNIQSNEDYNNEKKEAEVYLKEQGAIYAKADANLQWIKSEEELEEARKRYIEDLEEIGYSSEEAEDSFLAYAATVDKAIINEYVKATTGKLSLQEYAEKAFEKARAEAIDQAESDEGIILGGSARGLTETPSENQIDKLYSRIEEEGLDKNVAYMTEDEWAQFFTGSLDDATIENIVTTLRDKTTQVTDQMMKDIQSESNTYSESMGGIIDSAITNSLDASDEKYQELIEKLNSIKEVYPELTDEIETFSNEGLIGTEHWIQTAYQLQEVIDNWEFTNLKEKASEARLALEDAFDETKITGAVPGEDVIQITADTDKFQEAMDAILNAEYEIDVEVHSDAERDFNQLVSSLEQADSMADKIGEDFIVAADDIRELNQAFPGILQDIEYLGDGTIKLNEDIARSAMAAAAEEEEASTQALITKLQNSANELRAKADIYESMAEIAHQAAEGDISDDEAALQIKAKNDELEVENDRIASQSELDNAALVANDSQEKGAINAENWTESYQEAANASSEFAEVAIQNAAAAAAAMRGESGGSAVWKDFGSNYKGKNTQSSEAQSGKGIKGETSGSDYWNQQEQQYRDMAEAARGEANDIEGMIVAAAAKGAESLKKTGDAGKSSDKGGGGSEKEADHEEYLEREEDIYHEINKELEQIESTLGRIQNLEDHSWGASATANLEEENKLLDKQLEKLQEKKGMQESDLSVRRKQLENSGFTFSDDGSVINNSEAQLNALYAHYNQMVDAYNAMSAAEQETYKQELEAEKDRIDKIENKISEYESTYSDYQSVLDEIMDKHFEQIEKQVQAFNQDIEIHLELDEAKKEWTDFWYDIVQDMDDSDFAGQISKSVDKLKLLVGVGADATKSTVAQLTGHLNETITQVQAQIASANRGGEDSMFGDDSALSKETLEDYKKKLMDALTEAKQELDNISDSYLGMLDQAQEKIDKQVEGWEAISSHLDHNAKLIKMISGEKSYDSLNNMYEKQYENNLKLINTQKQSKEFWQQQMESERKQMEAAEKGSKDYKTHEEAYKKASENFRKAVSDLDSTVEEALEKLKEWRDNQLAAINDTMDKAISRGQGLDTITREWKLINDYSSAYLDNVERATEMEGLNKEFEKVLNTTNLTAEAQQKLNKMRDDEIKRLNEKNKLTQFDIDEVKARLEIRKQELALEDAQKNKSNLRLRRDSQGNYSYQYTGDDKAIEDAEGGVLNAKKDWWELVKKYQNDATSNYLDNLAKVNEIKKEMDQAEIDGDKQKYEALKTELMKYEEIVDFWAQESENSKRLLFKGTAEFFADIEDAEILPQWETTVSKIIDNWNNGGKDSFIGAVQQGIEDTELLQNEFAARTKEILDEAGVNYHSLKEDGIDPTTDALQDMVDTNEDLADTLEDINDLLGEQAEKLKDCEDSYNSLKQAAVDAIDEANRMIEELARTVIRSNQQVQASIQAAQNASSIWGNGGYSGGNGGSGGGGGGGSYPGGTNAVTQGGRYTLTMTDDKGGHSSSTYGDKSELKRKAKEAVARGKRISLYDRETKKLVTVNPDEYYKARESKIDSFKTGGYTGVWSDDIASGKLAVLHQKELVLNETDTSNILKAVELLRNIAIDKIANSIISAAQASASILNGINSGAVQNMANSITNETDNSYRNTTINADFSGVRSADAIYEALRNLENASMQSTF